MKIVDVGFQWKNNLSKRNVTQFVVLHHRAGDGDVESIHRLHCNNGWSGIGYHFYVRKDGTIYRGRPIGTVGAHCVGYNDKSIGVCFEGDFEKDIMSGKQIEAGRKIVSYLLNLYPFAKIVRHRDLGSTLCPGKNFDFEKVSKGACEMSVEEAIEIVQAKAGLEDGTMDFLLCYKYGEELLIKLAEAMT